MEFYRLEPWGSEAEDYQWAATRRMMAAATGAKRLGGLEAFMLRPPPKRGKSPEEMLEMLDRTIASAP